jgi:hypothetical protein
MMRLTRLFHQLGLPVAVGLFVGFWTLALTGALPSPQHPQASSKPVRADDMLRESRQDIAAETVAYYTKWLALFTGVLVLVSAGQGYLVLRAEKITRASATAAEIAANAADMTARTSISARLPNFAIEMVRRDNPNFPNDQITFRNYGTTPATVIADCLVLKVAPALDPVPRYPLGAVKDIGKDKVVGEQDTYEIVRSGSVTADDLRRVRNGETLLWAYGYIEFLDFMKVRRREGFCIAFYPARLTRAERLYETSLPTSLDWRREGPPNYTYTQTEQRS